MPAPSGPRTELARYRAQLGRWLQHNGLKLTKVHVLLERQGVRTSYATLRRFAIDEFSFGLRTPTIRLDDPAPGEEAQIDFRLHGRDARPETGKKRKVWVLIVCLSHSRYSFVYPTFTQDIASLCAGLDAGWNFFDGVRAGSFRTTCALSS